MTDLVLPVEAHLTGRQPRTSSQNGRTLLPPVQDIDGRQERRNGLSRQAYSSESAGMNFEASIVPQPLAMS